MNLACGRDAALSFARSTHAHAIACGISTPLPRPCRPACRRSSHRCRGREKFGEPVGIGEETAGTAAGGYFLRGACGLTQWATAQLLDAMSDLTAAARRTLASTSPHAFRHTTSTQMLATDIVLDVERCTAGRALLDMVPIYISPEEARLRRKAPKIHVRRVTPRMWRDCSVARIRQIELTASTPAECSRVQPLSR